jgi:hypothetical protein
MYYSDCVRILVVFIKEVGVLLYESFVFGLELTELLLELLALGLVGVDRLGHWLRVLGIVHLRIH